MSGLPLARVLVLAPHFPPEGGAAAARLGGLVRELRSLGHELRVVAPEPSYLLARGVSPVAGEEGLLRVPVPARRPGNWGNAVHQLRLLLALREAGRQVQRDFQAQVVLVSSPPPLAALAGLGLRRRDGAPVPLVIDFRDLWPSVAVEAGVIEEGSAIAIAVRALMRRLCEGAAGAVAVTETKLVRLRSELRIPLVLASNGIDPEWAEGGRAYGGGEEDVFHVLHAGNMGQAQDLSLLVRALALPGSEGAPRLRATLVGDGEERPAIETLARELGAPVRFVDPVSRTEVKELLADCGCAFVGLRTAALVDAVPSKLLETLGRGVPVVLAAAGESKRLLLELGGGLSVPPGDARALRRALETLASMDGPARQQMGAGARDRVLERFSRALAAAALSGLLQQVASRV